MEECDFGPVVVFPLDEKDPHFHMSCGIEEKEKILRIFGEFGLVVVRDIIPVEDVNDIEEELRLKTGLPSWNIAELGNVNWTSVYWSKYNESKGFVGYEPALGKHVCELRQNEAVLGIFETLLGTKKLAAKLDRFGLMRPTAGNPSWQTDKGFVHWDQNPTIEPDFARVQGVFLLSDHTETSGGFHAIPGFCKEKFAKYAEVHPSTLEDQDLIPVKDENLIKTQLQRIYARRGSLIIWDSRTPHGNWPNQLSEEWRKVLYLTYFPTPHDIQLMKTYGAMVAPYLKSEMSSRGRKLFGLDEYDDSDEKPKVCNSEQLNLDSAFSNRQNGLLF